MATLGFESPSTTAAPDTLFDYWLPRVSGAQLRVLLFLNRRCYGPDGHLTHEAVAVSAKQLLHGGCFPNGRCFDGCGIRNKTTLQKAVAGLEALGLVRKVRMTAPRGGDGANVYQLCVRDHPETPSTAGFRPLNTTPVPNELFDDWLGRLGDAELRALLYIVRHTLGWRKARDVISPQQFLVGIRARDGRIVDEGCGLKTEKHLYLALAALETYHLIQRTRRWRPDGGYGTTAYSLLFAGDLPHVLRPGARATPEELQSDASADDTSVEPFSGAGSRPVDRAKEPGQGGAGSLARGVQLRPDRGYGQDQIGGPVRTGYRGQMRPERESNHDGIGSTAATGAQETWSQESGSQEIQHHQHSARPSATTAGALSMRVGGAVPNEEKDAKETPVAAATAVPSPPARDGFAMDHKQACVMDESEQRMGQHADTPLLVLATEEEMRSYVLADDEVLIDAGAGGAQVMPLRAVVCNDILASWDSYAPVWTEVYYSIAHLLGEGGEKWTPDEERRIERQKALRVELDALYMDIGAFSLEEALGHYFTSELIGRFASSNPSERQRVTGWLRYVRGDAGASLTSPAGFLRTRLESGQWAPCGATSASERGSGRRRL